MPRGHSTTGRHSWLGPKCRNPPLSTQMPEEPELVRQMREAGRNPRVQQSYLSLLPHQAYITRESMRIEALVGNIQEGIEYLVSLGINAAKLKRELARLEQQYPMHFAGSNGGSGELTRKDPFYGAHSTEMRPVDDFRH